MDQETFLSSHLSSHDGRGSRAAMPFVRDCWYVAAFSWELGDAPLGRTLLGEPVVLFRSAHGVAALEDRCCHRSLPLSCGFIDRGALRCGYHGMLFDGAGLCIEVPGQANIPSKARVRSYTVAEQDRIVWIWMGSDPSSQPSEPPPRYGVHGDPAYTYRGGVFHYDAPYDLIHDNLLDLSHLGYVHTRTIGGDPGVHMEAPVEVSQEGAVVKVVRHLRGSPPPHTYTLAWPFRGRVDRWQEVEFHGAYLLIWAGAVDAGSAPLDGPERDGLHIRGFHGITPETAASSHYFWTVATNPHPGMADVTEAIREQVETTFREDKAIIEAQYRNACRFADAPQVDIRVDAGPNRVRRVLKERLESTRSERLCG